MSLARRTLLGLALITVLALVVACGGTPAARSIPPGSVLEPRVFARWHASEVIAAFRGAGLKAESVQGLSKDERDGLSTRMGVETIRFRISSTGDDQVGMILTFQHAADLLEMKKYYLGLNQSLPRYRSWIFTQDNILLQINDEVPEQKASEYRAVLDSLPEW